MGSRTPPPAGRGTTVTDEGEILTAVDVERMISAASLAMSGLRTALEDQATKAAQSKHDWLLARAKTRTRVRAEGGLGPGGRATNDEADDEALKEDADLHLQHLLTEAVYDSAKSAVKMVTSQMDGLRTIAANIRAQT